MQKINSTPPSLRPSKILRRKVTIQSLFQKMKTNIKTTTFKNCIVELKKYKTERVTEQKMIITIKMHLITFEDAFE